jgi:hypothetical protein
MSNRENQGFHVFVQGYDFMCKRPFTCKATVRDARGMMNPVGHGVPVIAKLLVYQDVSMSYASLSGDYS